MGKGGGQFSKKQHSGLGAACAGGLVCSSCAGGQVHKPQGTRRWRRSVVEDMHVRHEHNIMHNITRVAGELRVQMRSAGRGAMTAGRL